MSDGNNGLDGVANLFDTIPSIFLLLVATKLGLTWHQAAVAIWTGLILFVEALIVANPQAIQALPLHQLRHGNVACEGWPCVQYELSDRELSNREHCWAWSNLCARLQTASCCLLYHPHCIKVLSCTPSGLEACCSYLGVAPQLHYRQARHM